MTLISISQITSISVLSTPARAESLEEALISTYQHHPRLLAERARLREIDESYIQARSEGQLKSSAVGNYGFSGAWSHGDIFPGGDNYSDTNPGGLQLQVIQPLYQGGRVKALKTQARAQILAARERLRDAEQSVLLTAANAYADVIRDEEAARIRRNNVQILMRQLDVANLRFEVGDGTRTDVAQAQTRLASGQIGLAQAEAQLEVSRAVFVNYMNHPPAGLTQIPVFILPASLPEARRLARENNPLLIASIFNENASEAGIDVAKSIQRPSLSLNGSVSGSWNQPFSTFDRSEGAAISAQLTIPIFSGGLNKSTERVARSTRERLRFETRNLERQIDQAISQIWAQIQAAKATLNAARQQVEAAQIAFEGVELEQQVGTRTTLDVLNAEQELLDARLSVVNAQAELHKASFQLLATLGAFDAVSLNLPVEYYDLGQNLRDVSDIQLEEGWDENHFKDYVPQVIIDIIDSAPNLLSGGANDNVPSVDNAVGYGEQIADIDKPITILKE